MVHARVNGGNLAVPRDEFLRGGADALERVAQAIVVIIVYLDPMDQGNYISRQLPCSNETLAGVGEVLVLGIPFGVILKPF